jgi:hypothetical protein
MPDTSEKQCGRCKKTKARNNINFAKNKRSPDGFCSWCKDCQKIYRSGSVLDTIHKKDRNPTIPKIYELHDLNCNCKKCERKNEQIYKNQQGRGKADVAEVRGIENWNQIGSILRELAELQSGINEEEANYEKRVSMIRKYSNEVIEPYLAHQINLQTMLQNFLRKDGRKRLIRKYDFGIIKLFRGQLKIQLDADLAKQKMEKP